MEEIARKDTAMECRVSRAEIRAPSLQRKHEARTSDRRGEGNTGFLCWNWGIGVSAAEEIWVSAFL